MSCISILVVMHKTLSLALYPLFSYFLWIFWQISSCLFLYPVHTPYPPFQGSVQGHLCLHLSAHFLQYLPSCTENSSEGNAAFSGQGWRLGSAGTSHSNLCPLDPELCRWCPTHGVREMFPHGLGERGLPAKPEKLSSQQTSHRNNLSRKSSDC